MFSNRSLRADCAQCSGLCCTVPAFFAEQGFGYDKAAHQACRHLGSDHRCGIHPLRAAHGFPACAGFDCYGAGQWVTQRLFAGRSWRDAPEHADAMFAAYGRFRALHELLACVQVAGGVAPASAQALCQRWNAELVRVCDNEAVSPGLTDLVALRKAVLRDLRMQIRDAAGATALI